MLVPVPNPFQGLLPGTSLNGATVPRQQIERTFPQFGDLTEARRSLGTTDYDSLQVSLNKRMARGLQFLVSYTYSRRLEELTYLNAQDDWNNLTRVVTATDAPHRLLVSTTYQLPFYADQQGVMGSLLGGWQMNAIVVAQSGLPVGTTAGAELVGDPALEDPTLRPLVQHAARRRSPAAVRTARRRTNPPPGTSRRRSRFGTSRRASRTYGRTGRR